MKIRRTLSLAVGIWAFCSAVAVSLAQTYRSENGPQYVPGEVLVQFKPTATDAQLLDAVRRGGLVLDRVILPPTAQDQGSPGLNVAKVGRPVPQVIRALQGHPGVQFVEPNWIYQPSLAPNDPSYSSLWGMKGGFGSNAETGWEGNTTGSRSVVVAIIDTGVDINHPDLADNIWTNPGEIPGNGFDDDGNGKVDDIHGWDFERNDNSVYDGKQDDHGTHVAGTIGGVGNNGIGVAGVNWQVSMIPAKFLGRRGGSTADAISAINYLRDLKSRHGLNLVAINASWGGGGYSQALANAITAAGAEDILFVAAAGNGDFFGNAVNTDNSPHYPSSYNVDSIISVTAIDINGNKASWANYGAQTVDLGAPGVSILSTLPQNTYGSYSGTSMATPHVTGAVALYASRNAGATASQIKTTLFTAGTSTPSLGGKTVTGDRLDLSTVIGGSGGTGGTGSDNQRPTANDQTVTVVTGQSVNITLTGSDPDGDTLTFTIDGQLDGTLGGTAPNLTYTAGSTATTDTFTFTVSDGTLISEPATVTVNVTDLKSMDAKVIGLTTEEKGRNLKGTVVVSVFETNLEETPVPSATVDGTWYLMDGNTEPQTLAVSGITDSTGTVTFSVNVRNGAGSGLLLDFAIDDVTATGYVYVPPSTP